MAPDRQPHQSDLRRPAGQRLKGKLATVIDQIEHGHHVFRANWKHVFLKQYEKFSRFLRNELVSNNLHDFGLKKGLDHLDAVRKSFQIITDRFAGFQAQSLNVHVDFPLLQRIALPITVGSVRFPGIKIHYQRIIRLLEVLLHNGSTVGGWTAKQIHEAVITTFQLSAKTYGLNQLRYDLRKLKGHGCLFRSSGMRSDVDRARAIRVGVRPANDFGMDFGMKFLDEAMRAHPKHLNEKSKHRWIKAIYTLADFKRTGILSLRREKRGFVFSELAKPAFQQFTAHRPLDYPKRTYATRAFIWSVSRNTWSNNAWRTLQDLTTGMYKGSLMVWPYTNYPRSDAARKQKCLRLTRQTRSSVWSTASTGETREAKKETR